MVILTLAPSRTATHNLFRSEPSKHSNVRALRRRNLVQRSPANQDMRQKPCSTPFCGSCTDVMVRLLTRTHEAEACALGARFRNGDERGWPGAGICEVDSGGAPT